MYDLTEKEFEKYTNNNLFRMACEKAYCSGFSKEQMLSELAIALLEEKEEVDRRKVKEILLSAKPHIFLNN